MAIVSIVVPIYNAGNLLRACINSILNQSLNDIEVICINDGSTDNSLEILKNFADQDERIKIYSQKNKGLAAARNLGLEHASAEYIMFCDADDYYDERMCEIMFHKITGDNADIAVCEIQVHYHANDELKESDDNYYQLKFNKTCDNIKNIINHIDLSACNKIFRRKLIKYYNICFPTGYNYEDANFCWKYFSISNKCAFINEKLYHYNRNEGSIMNLTFSKSARAIDHIIIANDVFKFLKKNNKFDKFKFEFAEFYIASFNFTKRYIKRWYFLKFFLYNAYFTITYRIYYHPDNPFLDTNLLRNIRGALLSYLKLK